MLSPLCLLAGLYASRRLHSQAGGLCSHLATLLFGQQQRRRGGRTAGPSPPAVPFSRRQRGSLLKQHMGGINALKRVLAVVKRFLLSLLRAA
jgi:hypothetical protein